ncbi:MAG TPA: VanZ family protein [Acidobacteriaceae bacterium]|nr:VanZ family protein [Acidobacteriaceae bacterium]
MPSASYLFLTSPGPACTGWPALLRTWLPVAVLLSLFCLESTTLMGADHTSGPLHALTHAVTGARVEGHWSMIHHLIRKTGHFFGYGVFSLACLRSFLLAAHPRRDWRKLQEAWGMQLAAVAATFVVAGLDELHQSFLPNRTGKFSDVLLDTAGALALQMALRLASCLVGMIEAQREICTEHAEIVAA